MSPTNSQEKLQLADIMRGTKVEVGLKEKFVWGVLEVMGCELQEKKQFHRREQLRLMVYVGRGVRK